MVKISLITATRNQASTIEETIRSVFAQSYTNIEYIIVDGESTDNTSEIVRTWEPRFGGRLKYIVESDNGVFEAINNGIMAATGDIIGLVHADDRLTCTSVLTTVAEAFESNSVDLVYGDVHFVESDNADKVLRYYSGEHFERWMLRYGFAPPHPAMYCRREVFDRCGLYRENYKVAADFEMFARLLWIPRVRYMYLPLDMVAMRTGGISTRWGNRLLLNTFEKHKALRENGIRTSFLLLPLRYVLNMRHYFHKTRNRVENRYDSELIIKYESVE